MFDAAGGEHIRAGQEKPITVFNFIPVSSLSPT